MIPQFRDIFIDFDTQLPWLTLVVMDVAAYMPAIVIGMIVLSVLGFTGAALLRATGKEQTLMEIATARSSETHSKNEMVGVLIPWPLAHETSPH